MIRARKMARSRLIELGDFGADVLPEYTPLGLAHGNNKGAGYTMRCVARNLRIATVARGWG